MDQFVVGNTSYTTDAKLTRRSQRSGYARQRREGLELGLKFPLKSSVG